MERDLSQTSQGREVLKKLNTQERKQRNENARRVANEARRKKSEKSVEFARSLRDRGFSEREIGEKMKIKTKDPVRQVRRWLNGK